MTMRIPGLIVSLVLCLASSRAMAQEQSDTCVTALFAGDLHLSDAVAAYVDGDTSYVFAKWDSIGPFDLFVANLEHPITTATQKVEKEFNFKLDPRYVPTLHQAGLGAVNVANNHIADFGLQGLTETMHWLDSAKIPYFGIGRTLAEARKPCIIEKKGRRIALLGYSGNGAFAASARSPGKAPVRETMILDDVRLARDSADVVVVNIHWGEELAEAPSAAQIRLAHRIIDAGADLIIGHHPHVLQGIECYGRGVIAYSLGNFVFGGNNRSVNASTAVVRLTVCAGRIEVEALPVAVRNWQPQRADSVSAERVFRQLRTRSRMFERTIPELTQSAGQ